MVLVITSVSAQDALEIIESAAKVYGDATAYSAQVESRTITLAFSSAPTGQTPQHEVLGTQYRRLQLKIRRPNDYLLGSQTYGDGSFGQTHANWSYLARSEGTPPKRGVFIGGKFSIRDVAAEQFPPLVNSRLGARVAEDLVLRHFQLKASEGQPTAGTPGLIEPSVIGQETGGHPTYRIIANTSDGYPIMIWIEKNTFLIVRTIVQRPPMQRPSKKTLGVSAVSGATSDSGGGGVTVVETLYKNQQLSPKFTQADFVIPQPTPLDRANAEQLGFIDVAELVKLADVGPIDAANPTAPGETPPAEEAPAADEQSKSSAATENQALSYEQMSGIVLIDGDGGTATGFMTKIRDVDFVVTNQHVLVGNKKLTLKTLRGEEIPIMGIFGATGCDIAIIRIAKGHGELRLATDVFQSSKIGDKVVVVGNRRGGGVATQTTGNIKGVGPSLIEVDANFQPGNSGSPIMNLRTNEVIGVATYSATRRVEVEEPSARANAGAAPKSDTVEKRWFGYRLDSVSKWEAIDLARLNVQADRIDKFRETSEALVAVIKFDFKTARQHPRFTAILDNFETRYRAASTNSVAAAGEVKDLFRIIRTISEDGVRDLTTGDYYDYYRTCQYWENSITAQLDYRKEIVDILKKYEANSSLYVSRMRNGG